MPTKAELEQQVEQMQSDIDALSAQVHGEQKDRSAAWAKANELEGIRVDLETRLLDYEAGEGPAGSPDLRSFVDRCRTPFPAEQIGVMIRSGCRDCKDAKRWQPCQRHSWVKSGKCDVLNCAGNHESSAVHLDYVGHAEVTARLLELDPQWNWEPIAFDAEGKPVITKRESEVSMWIRLTINGITRLGVGVRPTSKDEVEKELIGYAIRNAAMRFGIGLDLWSKSETLDGTFDREEAPADAPQPTAAPEEEKRADTAPEGSDAAQGESEALPPEPQRPVTGVDRDALINGFLKLKGQHALDARHLLEDEGLWPVLDIPDDRVEVAAGLILPILDRQEKS